MIGEWMATCPEARITKANALRAARLVDPEFFPALEGNTRQVAIPTLENGFLPMLMGAQRGVNTICDMCRAARGEKYDPMRCMKRCRVFEVQEKMEDLQTALTAVLRIFHKPDEGKEDNGGQVERRQQ